MFFVATVRLAEDKLDDFRPVGFYRRYGRAEYRILNNACDIFECGYYKYAVIIKIYEGLYPDNFDVAWFKYEDGQVTNIPESEELREIQLPVIVG